MGSAVFTSNAYSGVVTYADGEGHSYTPNAGANSCTLLRYGRWIRDVRTYYAPGEDGGGTKDFGFRGQELFMEMIYVQATEGACIAGMNADLITLATSCSLLYTPTSGAAVTFPATTLQSFDGTQPKKTPGVAFYWMLCKATLLGVR